MSTTSPPLVISQTSDTAATSSSSGGSTPSGGFFSANGTPALILAFLAIGLFVGGMVTMFGLRRRRMLGIVVGNRFIGVRRNDAWDVDVPEDVVRQRAERRRRKFGKKPELWDCYVGERGKEATEEVRWEKVMPISAKVISIDPPFFSTIPTRPAEAPPTYFSRLHTLVPQSLQSLRRAPSALNVSTPRATPASLPTHVEVAVAIAMPVPPMYQSESGMVDFSLGLAELPWDAEKQARVVEGSGILSEDERCISRDLVS